jgi:5'-nucleotidase
MPDAVRSEATGETHPLILVSNDDGIDAPGLRALAEVLTDLGEVYVVAPMSEQSAVGHAITVRDPVRARPWPEDAFRGVAKAFAVTGTPADCVKLALGQLVPRTPSLVCSGINNGPNTAVNVIYSGTVSAATEGTILGIDSIAFSQCAWGGTRFDESARWARRIAAEVLRRGLPPGILLNANIPFEPEGGVQGIRVTRQAKARWEESFDPRMDPFDQPYYWSKGRFVNLDEGTDTDLAAIEDGYVSVTPIHYDLTAYEALRNVEAWTWE